MHQRRNGDCLVTNGAAAAAAAAPAPAPATATAKGTAAGATAARCGCYFSLACSIGSMGLACGSLWQIPNTTDRITLQRGLFLTSLGFIYFISLTDFCNKYFLETKRGQQFRQKYRLMISDVLEITNKWVENVHIFIDTPLTYIYLCLSVLPWLPLTLFSDWGCAHSLTQSFIHSQRVKVKCAKWQVPKK